MPNTITPLHNFDSKKSEQAFKKLNELKVSNESLYRELLKFTVKGGFDEVYREMKRREILS